MSHSNGAAKFNDGKIFHCEYNGTVDIMIPFLYDTTEEMRANWRRPDWITCSNPEGHTHQRVRLATSYGGGFSWDGFACIDCKCLLSPLEPNYDTLTDGLPEWFPIENTIHRIR